MKKFIFCDLHIGHKDAKCDVITEAIKYVRGKAQEGDEIWGLGDWFHMREEGVGKCRGHAVTQEILKLADDIPIKLIPGNHDDELESNYSEFFKPIQIVTPFEKNGIWYCHGHEFDPACQLLPKWWQRLWGRLTRKRTPGVLKGKAPTQTYLMAVHLVHSRAILNLLDEIKKGKNYRGIVLGHTHLPLQQECPELPFLLNGGDMRDSSTFIVQQDDGFHLMQWNGKQWQETSSLKV